MPASKAKAAEVAERRAKLIRLRRQGISFDDPRIMALGYATRSAASKDMIRALKERRDEQAAEVSVYRQEENERLDALLEAIWPIAVGQATAAEGAADPGEVDLKAVETVLKLMDRRAKLNGYDMPVKSELSGPGGGAVPLSTGTLAELNTLISIAGQAGIEAGSDDAEGDGDDSDG